MGRIMGHVFVSYVRENSAAVDRLIEDLRTHGVDTWIDRRNIPAGALWESRIAEAVSAATLFIACFSEEYGARSETFMNRELELAAEEIKRQAKKPNWFVPVLLSPCGLPALEIGGGKTVKSLQGVGLFLDWQKGIRDIAAAVRPLDTIGFEHRRRVAASPSEGRPDSSLIAFDFGTSHSCAAVLGRDMKVHLIPSATGSPYIPSAITFDERRDYWVGTEALHIAPHYPDGTVLNVKRVLGTDKGVKIHDATVAPERLASLIILSLRRNAEEYLQRPVTDAVVSAPADFGVVQTNALVRAFELAGINVRRVIGEPSAAALLLNSTLSAFTTSECRVLVLDLGGGTFDVSVILYNDGIYEVLAAVGCESLGGSDYDDALLDLVRRKLDGTLNTSFHNEPSDRMRLRLEASRAKAALGTRETTTMTMTGLSSDGQAVTETVVEVSRAEFRTAVQRLDVRVESCIDEGLRMAYVKPAELDFVLVAGMGLKVFTIAELLDRRFPGPRQIREFQEGAVIHGLCRYTGVLQQFEAASEVVLLDVNSTTIGVQVASGEGKWDFVVSSDPGENTRTYILLRPSTTVPTQKRYIGTTRGFGPVELRIVELHGPDSGREEEIGRIQVPTALPGQELEIRIDCDANDVMELQVRTSREEQAFQLNHFFVPCRPGVSRISRSRL
jgi:molecular chaperone DnaK (HSP70)